jgi:hypothetical protein
VGGASATVATRSHRTALRTEDASLDWEYYNTQSHLFPKELSNAICTDSVAAQAKHTNKHHEKQDDVSNEENNDVELVALGVEHRA